MTPPVIFLSILLLFLAGVVIYAFFLEPYLIRVSRVNLTMPNLPAELDGFTICHLSDTHTQSYGKFETLLCERLKSLKSDLCLLTGDLVNSREGMAALVRVLACVNARYGVYAVPGNNDHNKSGLAISEISATLAGCGIRLLVNENITPLTNGVALHIIGLDDPFLAYDDIERAIDGMGEGGFRILIAHSPDILVRLCGVRPDLILAGHTHAGQIRIPFIGALALHTRYRLGISHGHLDSEALSQKAGCSMDGVQMYVSRGLSGGIIRARLMSPPEIALITLRAGSGSD